MKQKVEPNLWVTLIVSSIFIFLVLEKSEIERIMNSICALFFQ